MSESRGSGVLVVYTGGTIGSLPKSPDDPHSPLVPGTLEEILRRLPGWNAGSRTMLLEGVRVPLGLLSWREPLDSSNISLADWQEMARVVSEHYEEYEGFVILHGTDTMAFTASALAFMLRNLAKPVILTGSQRPIGQPRSDAAQNLVTAIELAAAELLGGVVVPEVCVFFRDQLFRGCRARKLDATSFAAFASPKYPALGSVGERVVIDRRLICRHPGEPLRLVERLEPHIASLDVFPGMSATLLRNLLRTEGLRGVVLKTFGTGNAPSTPEFLDAIGEAIRAGITIVDVSQCASGEVELGLYDVSSGLLSRGVVSGLDMTPEAALTKMCVVLGGEPEPGRAADLMQLDLAGEQRQSIHHLHYPGGGTLPGGWAAQLAPIRPMTCGPRGFEPRAVEEAMLRVIGLTVDAGAKSGGDTVNVTLRAYLDASAEEAGATDGLHCLGEFTRAMVPGAAPESVFLPVTAAARRLLEGAGDRTLTLSASGGEGVRWERVDLALFCGA